MIANINSRCTFVLTASGAEVWNASFRDVPVEYRPAPKAVGATVTTQLWTVMQVFGPHIFLGMPSAFFANNNLEITPC